MRQRLATDFFMYSLWL